MQSYLYIDRVEQREQGVLDFAGVLLILKNYRTWLNYTSFWDDVSLQPGGNMRRKIKLKRTKMEESATQAEAPPRFDLC